MKHIVDKEIGDLIKIAEALESFKVKVYTRMNRGDKEFDDFVMNDAPCNYNLQKIIQKLRDGNRMNIEKIREAVLEDRLVKKAYDYNDSFPVKIGMDRAIDLAITKTLQKVKEKERDER